jgi:muramoyltetrapeptide carboxypeptidase LdcA involved in peptidoglycan recycling
MMTQIDQAGGLDEVRAIVLGDFTNCDDESSTCFKPLAPGEDPRVLLSDEKRERVPLRRVFKLDEAMRGIFYPIWNELRIPIATGLPVGHGPNFNPLPLGAQYRLDPNGKLSLLKWDWIGCD